MESKGLILRVYGEERHELDLPDLEKVREYIATRSPLCGVDERNLVQFGTHIMHVANRDYGERVVDFRYSEDARYSNVLNLAQTIKCDHDKRWCAEVLPVADLKVNSQNSLS